MVISTYDEHWTRGREVCLRLSPKIITCLQLFATFGIMFNTHHLLRITKVLHSKNVATTKTIMVCVFAYSFWLRASRKITSSFALDWKRLFVSNIVSNIVSNNVIPKLLSLLARVTSRNEHGCLCHPRKHSQDPGRRKESCQWIITKSGYTYMHKNAPTFLHSFLPLIQSCKNPTDLAWRMVLAKQ